MPRRTDYRAFTLQLIEDLQELGATIDSIYDGEEEIDYTDKQSERASMVKDALASDSGVIYASKGDEEISILLVFGNDIEETIADWRGNPDGELWRFIDKWVSAL